MRAATLALIVAAVLLLLLFAPSPLAPVRGAAAWHTGTIECGSDGTFLSDGAIAPGEYGENYFDGTTKLLVYLDCDNSTERPMHVGIVSPWSGWVGVLVQATDGSAEVLNEVRVGYVPTSGSPRSLDAFRNATAGVTTPDADLGGTSDVYNLTTGTVEAARVFEFSVSLRSADRFDSQLTTAGPFAFALEYATSASNLLSEPAAISEAHSLGVEPTKAPGAWTSLEFAVVPASAPTENSTMLISLRDPSGYPVPSTQIEVFVYTAFGFYDLGPVVTNEQGVAPVSYVPRDSGTYLIGAAYTGGYGLLASVAWRQLAIGSGSSSGEIGLGPFESTTFELRLVEALIVVGVLGVWATYAYAFFVTRISMREDRTRPFGRDARSNVWRPWK